MTHRIRLGALAVLLALVAPAFEAMAAVPVLDPAQADYERENKAVVRNKQHFKKGRLELAAGGGTNPFDLSLSQTTLFARATWHIGDAWGWEVVNGFFSSPKAKSYITQLARDKGLSNVQLAGFEQGATTSLVWTPVYAKTRLFGASVLFFDVYGILGGGMAAVKTIRLSSPALGTDATITETGPDWKPVIDIGIGFRLYFNNTLSLIVDFRDYVLLTTTYGKSKPLSNYTTNLLIGVML